MLKKALIAFVVGGGGYLLWRYFDAVSNTRYDAVESDGGFLSVSTNLLSDVKGSFVSGVNDDLSPSLQVIASMKGYEELRLVSYFATEHERAKGWRTIGYGHLITDGTRYQEPISEAFANELFMKDLNEHIAQIYTKINVRLNQHQFDALCHFCFNTGRSALKVYFGLTNLINAGDFDKAADKFMQYVTQGGQFVTGLYNRRVTEMQMFKFGIYKRFNG